MRSRARVLARVGGVVSLGSALASPFVRHRPGRWLLVDLTVGSLALYVGAAESRRSGSRRAAAAAATVAGLGQMVESVGVRTGRPFGRYRYTGALRPRVDGVPSALPLAWFAMASPAREVARAVLGTRSTVTGRIALGAAALTAWDLFLDPQMTAEGYWAWERPGRYRGVPIGNFAGWFATGLAVMSVLEVLNRPSVVLPELVGAYVAAALLETAAFSTFLGDRRVALIGGVAMMPLAALAMLRMSDRAC